MICGVEASRRRRSVRVWPTRPTPGHVLAPAGEAPYIFTVHICSLYTCHGSWKQDNICVSCRFIYFYFFSVLLFSVLLYCVCDVLAK